MQRWLWAAVFLFCGVNAWASSVFNYNFAELNVVDYDVGDSGIQVAGSYDINRDVNLLGAISIADLYTQFDFGAGYHMRWNEFEKADVQFFGGVMFGEFDLPAPLNLDDSGIFFGAGLRLSPAKQLELNAALHYQTIFDNDFVLSIAGMFEFTPGLQARLGLQVSDNDVVTLGVRYNFK